MDSHLSKSSSVLVRSEAESTRSAFQRRVASLAVGEQLWLQASLDGELPEGACKEECRSRASQAGAQLLLRELNLLKFALAGNERARCVPENRVCYWNKIERAIHSRSATEHAEPGCVASEVGVPGILRKESIMKTSNRILRGIACGGLSLALLSGIGLPMSAFAAPNSNSNNSSKMVRHRQEFWAMREKMLSQAKAEDAALQKMVAELKKAPEAKKPDLEAAILSKLVAQHHQMLGEWEHMHARMMQFRKERMQTSTATTSGGCMRHGMMGQKTTTAQK